MTSDSEPIPEIHYRGSFDIEQILGKLIRNVSIKTRSFKLIVSLDEPVGQIHQLVSSINLTNTFGIHDRSVFRLEDWEVTRGVHSTFTFYFVRGCNEYQYPSALGMVRFDAHLDRYDGRYHLELRHMKNLPVPERDCSLDQLTAWIRNSRTCSGRISMDMYNCEQVLEIYRILQSFPRSRISYNWADDRSSDSTENIIVEFGSNSIRDSEGNIVDHVFITIVLPILIILTIVVMSIKWIQP